MAALSKGAEFSVELTLIAPILIVSKILFIVLSALLGCVDAVQILSSTDILSLSKSRCVVAVSFRLLQQTKGQDDAGKENLLGWVDMAFREEENVVFGVSDFDSFVWPSGKRLTFDDFSEPPPAVVFPRIMEDRTCLLKPENFMLLPEASPYTRDVTTADDFTDFVNSLCSTFRRANGELTIEGLHRQSLLEQLFRVQDLEDSRTISDIFQSALDPIQCQKRDGAAPCELHRSAENRLQLYKNVPKCERIPMPSKSHFFHDFLTRSKPVIITGAMDHWPALRKWTNEFFRMQYGDKQVHVKLTPKGEYEGIESASIWDSFKTFKIPPAVLKKLLYPDLVVVRPATADLSFYNFLDLIGNVSEGLHSHFSAYLEYTSLSDYFPELKDDIAEMPFIQNLLRLQYLNIWLSDGNTLGKTHFDPFDNFLCQISGSKELILFEPYNNELLYEAHIPEALLTYNTTSKQFKRSTLLDSTSMVMTPIDILNPDIQRFPNFGGARPLSCTIKEGEVLFMPAFWWHEVQSRPSSKEKRNLAINFWYEPFFTKEFPCPDCQLDVNPKYTHLL